MTNEHYRLADGRWLEKCGLAWQICCPGSDGSIMRIYPYEGDPEPLISESKARVAAEEMVEELQESRLNDVTLFDYERKHWQAIARAAEAMERDRCGWIEVRYTLDSACFAGLMWEQKS